MSIGSKGRNSGRPSAKNNDNKTAPMDKSGKLKVTKSYATKWSGSGKPSKKMGY